MAHRPERCWWRGWSSGLSSACQRTPACEALLLNRGRAAVRLGKPDDAARDLGQLLAADPRNGEGRYLLGMAYIMKGEHARALAVLDPLALDEKSMRAYYGRALAYHGLKRKADATADIENAIRLAPGNQNLPECQAQIPPLPPAPHPHTTPTPSCHPP